MHNREQYYTLMNVAYAFAVLATVICALATIISMAWMIPMTINIRNRRDSLNPTPATALGVCSLIFLSLISGVLILVANSYTSEKEHYY